MTGFDRLLREIDRYLATVDAFRAEGCEPRWRPEISHCSEVPSRKANAAIVTSAS